MFTLPIKMIIEMEDEYVALGYRHGLDENKRTGWCHDTEPFIYTKDEIEFLQSMDKLSSWKCSASYIWKEKKVRGKG